MSFEHECGELKDLASIAGSVLQEYEIRGIYRLIENGPAGQKSELREEVVGRLPWGDLVGGILYACPTGDVTNGKSAIEISTRDKRIIMLNRRAPSSAAMRLQRAYERDDKDFSIELR